MMKTDIPATRPRAVARLAGLAAGALALAAFAAPSAMAQDYPAKPVTMVIGFAPGGGSDVTGRVVSAALEKRLGQPVVVENRPGAGSTVAAKYVADAEADGYTLMYMSSDGVSLGAALRPGLSYSPLEDFDYVARIAGFPYIVAVNPELPVKSLKELVDYAKANPGKLRYGSSGVGSGPQMAAELFAHSNGIEMEHVAFQGAAPAVTATIGGHIEVVLAAPSSIQQFGESGQLRVLGVTGSERHPNFPDAPTPVEDGLPELVVTIWWGVVAPDGTPEPVLERLRTAMAEIAEDPEVAAQLNKLGYDVIYLDHEAFATFAAEDVAQWTETAKNAGITLD